MRRGYLLMITAALTAAAAPVGAQEPAGGSVEDAAAAVVRRMADGDFAGVAAGFDSTMAVRAPAPTLREIWERLQAQAGEFQRIAGTARRSGGAFQVGVVTAVFARTTLDVVIAFDSAGRISGLHFVPTAAAQPTTPAPYADSSAYTEREVTVGSLALPGTLSLPRAAGPVPAVVLVHGSGPNDRNESVGGVRVFADLAGGLASRGIAVLRYEKRTRAHPESLKGGFTVTQETEEDARAAANLLAGTPGIDPHRVYLLGHSLGGLMAPRIARGDSSIAGIIILAGSTRPLPQVIQAQLDYLESLQPADDTVARAELERMREGARRAAALTPADSLDPNPVMGAPASYWLDLAGYDPAATAAELQVPILVLQGGRDYQVTRDDFAGWQRALAGRPDATLHLFPELNHLFVAGTGPSTPEEYARPAHVAPEVVDWIARWISGLSGRGERPPSDSRSPGS